MQGENNEHLVEEFQSEIQMLSQVEHMNLVKFYGYVEYEDEKVVVLEYVPNGNLRQHLNCKFYNWVFRVFGFQILPCI